MFSEQLRRLGDAAQLDAVSEDSCSCAVRCCVLSSQCTCPVGLVSFAAVCPSANMVGVLANLHQRSAGRIMVLYVHLATFQHCLAQHLQLAQCALTTAVSTAGPAVLPSTACCFMKCTTSQTHSERTHLPAPAQLGPCLWLQIVFFPLPISAHHSSFTRVSIIAGVSGAGPPVWLQPAAPPGAAGGVPGGVLRGGLRPRAAAAARRRPGRGECCVCCG